MQRARVLGREHSREQPLHAGSQPDHDGDHGDERGIVRDFRPRSFTFGSLGLKLKGRKGATRIKQEIDIEAVAPYSAAAGRISLGRGTYKLRYIRNVITTSNGVTVPVRLPSTSTATPRGGAGYTCTPNVLHLRVPLGGDRGVELTLQRDRG